QKTITSPRIGWVEKEVTLEGPDASTPGSNFNVSWSTSMHRNDVITIVPADTEDGKRAGGNQYFRVGDKTSGSLTAPADPGLYEEIGRPSHRQIAITPKLIEVVERKMTLKT